MSNLSMEIMIMMTKTYNKILIGITGAIGAINVYNYFFVLKNEFQCQIETVITDNAKQFISKMALTNVFDYVYDELFTSSMKSPHVNIVQNVDLFLILPASANFLSKMAHGVGDDLLSCCVLNYAKPIYIAPNMNEIMWNNPRIQQNIITLKEDGHIFVNVESFGYKTAQGSYIKSDASLPQPQELVQYILNRGAKADESRAEIRN